MDVDIVIRLRVVETGEDGPLAAIDEAQDFLRTFLDSADSIGEYEFVLAAPVLED